MLSAIAVKEIGEEEKKKRFVFLVFELSLSVAEMKKKQLLFWSTRLDLLDHQDSFHLYWIGMEDKLWKKGMYFCLSVTCFGLYFFLVHTFV